MYHKRLLIWKENYIYNVLAITSNLFRFLPDAAEMLSKP